MIPDLLADALAVGYRPALDLTDRIGRRVGPVLGVVRADRDTVTVRGAWGEVEVPRVGGDRGLRLRGGR